MNRDTKASYRQIIKATSIFGGVQVVKILISIVRSKIIAVLLGPSGMGVAGLLTSTTGLMGALTNFGLGISAVRNIAEVNERGNETKMAKIIIIFRKLVWITGILGTVIMIILSSWLSEITFGNKDYSVAFIWLSCTLLFSQLTSGQNVLLQGMRKLNYLAKANMIGSLLGLFVSVPMYYYWRVDGIVPALVITSLTSFGIAKFFAKKLRFKKVDVTRVEIITESKNMLNMGILLSLSGLITLGVSFLLRIYINKIGGVEDVGLYTAGFAMVTTYVGLVFTAMGTDYYPKLSAAAHSNKKSTLLINQQSEIGILILAPLLTVFLIFINSIVIILYSTKFVPVNSMIQWAALGMYFKVISWCLGFLLLAKAATKVYFWTELTANCYILFFNIVGYKMLGLEGLGISYLLGYFFYLLQIYLTVRMKYKFSFNNDLYKIFGFQLIIGLCCFLVIKIIPSPGSYLLGLPFICLSIWYSYHELDKRIGLKSILKGFIQK